MTTNLKNNQFSKNYKTFNEWLTDQLADTDYKHRIIRLHSLYPDASLSQLRGHARKKEKPLIVKQEVTLYKRSWLALSPREKTMRRTALNVISDVRTKGNSLSKACKDHNITLKTVLKTTNAFKKTVGRWTAKKHDNISRDLKISEDGREISIEITDSRVASLIGSYHNAVKKYLETGDYSLLKKYEGKTITDANGIQYTLETDTEALEEISEGIEDSEFHEIYGE